jgi:hypothetical protein
MKAHTSLITVLTTVLTILFLSAQPRVASAQVDTIRLKDKRLNTTALKPGMRQYMVYFQSPKAKKVLWQSLWLRNTQIMDRDGEKVFVTTQHWFGNDSSSYRTVYSVNRVSDFLPIYHSETVAGKNKSFNWSESAIQGADSVTVNTQKSFLLNFTAPCYNWNLDIETFEMLPLAAGKTFAINFYDAGFGKPEYVIYKVTGSEVIQTLDNHRIDCWTLQNVSEHNGQKSVQIFWISKRGHEFIKEEDSFAGNYRYKIKLPATAFNVLTRF